MFHWCILTFTIFKQNLNVCWIVWIVWIAENCNCHRLSIKNAIVYVYTVLCCVVGVVYVYRNSCTFGFINGTAYKPQFIWRLCTWSIAIYDNIFSFTVSLSWTNTFTNFYFLSTQLACMLRKFNIIIINRFWRPFHISKKGTNWRTTCTWSKNIKFK